MGAEAVYVDTSAVVKLVKQEAESDALETEVNRLLAARDIELVSSYLLVLELEAIAGRQASSPDVNVQAIPGVLARIGTISLDQATAEIARTLVRRHALRSPDALHLAAAIEVEAGAIIAYDVEFVRAAGAEGIPVVRPGVA